MKKSTVFYAALMSALATPAFADGDGWRFVDGEAVWGYFGGTVEDKKQTNDAVQREHSDYKGSAVSADAWKWVGGEAGWLYVGPRTETRTSAASASAGPSGVIR